MKKIISLLLAIAIVFTFTACGGKGNSPAKSKKPETTSINEMTAAKTSMALQQYLPTPEKLFDKIRYIGIDRWLTYDDSTDNSVVYKKGIYGVGYSPSGGIAIVNEKAMVLSDNNPNNQITYNYDSSNDTLLTINTSRSVSYTKKVFDAVFENFPEDSKYTGDYLFENQSDDVEMGFIVTKYELKGYKYSLKVKEVSYSERYIILTVSRK